MEKYLLVSELKAKKTALIKEITKLVREYEAETTTKVKSIRVVRLNVTPRFGDETDIFSNIDLETTY